MDAMCARDGDMVKVFAFQLFCIFDAGGFAVCRYFVGVLGGWVLVGFVGLRRYISALLFFGRCAHFLLYLRRLRCFIRM